MVDLRCSTSSAPRICSVCCDMSYSPGVCPSRVGSRIHHEGPPSMVGDRSGSPDKEVSCLLDHWQSRNGSQE